MQQRFVNDEEQRATAHRDETAAHARRVAADASTVHHNEESEALLDEATLEQTRATLESKRRAHTRLLLIQPALYWSVLMLVAATTGILSSANPSLRQPILLHAIPQALALLAGYRLKDPKLGALSGASFHVARALLILMLSAWPQFSSVLSEHPAQMLWLFLLPPALGALGGVIGQNREKLRSRRGERGGGRGGFRPIPPLAAGLALIAATTGGIAPRFMAPADAGFGPVGRIPMGGGMMRVPPIAPPAAPMMSIFDGPVRVGNGEYQYRFEVGPTESLDIPAVPGSIPMLSEGTPLASADGSSALRLDPAGNLVWDKAGETSRIIAQGSEGAFSNLSLSADGNMAVFQQGEQFQVYTPSKNTRAIEDLVRQFWKDAPETVVDGSVLSASWDSSGSVLHGIFRDLSGQLKRFSFALTRE